MSPVAGIALIGGGGHARAVADWARAAGIPLAGFHDDDARAHIGGLTHLGPVGRADRAAQILIAIGDLADRRRVIEQLADIASATCVHPSAAVSPQAEIGAGVVVGPNAVVNAGAHLGAHAIVNSGAIIEHDAQIGENAHIAPGAVLAGEVRVGANTLVGLGSRVLPGVRIGEGATIGAGAVVLRDVPGGQVAAGVPARALDRGR